MCDPRAVDWLVIAFVAFQALMIAIFAAVALSRGRTLDGVADGVRDGDVGAPNDLSGE